MFSVILFCLYNKNDGKRTSGAFGNKLNSTSHKSGILWSFEYYISSSTINMVVRVAVHVDQQFGTNKTNISKL
jgi:hypothetical protein